MSSCRWHAGDPMTMWGIGCQLFMSRWVGSTGCHPSMVCWSCYASDGIAALPCRSGTFDASYPWCPWYAANGVLPIHIHGSRPTCLHHLFYIPLLAMGAVSPPIVCRPSMVPMLCRQWCAANPSCPWYAAHPYSWLSAHPSTSSTSYTTYPSTYYTIYTVIGYGHCRPTHGMPPINGAHGMPPIVCHPSIVPIVCSPSIFMALGPPVYIIYFISHLS
jgi:hypothetical protein